ncbi:hypothetical protein P865_13720 [Brucella abortus 82]|nr:hypothetical protein P865_13720 [Brucella abortus 82]
MQFTSSYHTADGHRTIELRKDQSDVFICVRIRGTAKFMQACSITGGCDRERLIGHEHDVVRES